MEDGPKLLPQWLRGNSSLHNRGDSAADSFKRAKAAGPIDASTRQQPQGADPWLSRAPSGPTSNGGGHQTSSASGKAPVDYGRLPDRGSQTERPWKPRSDSSGGFAGPPHRSSYVAAPVKSSGGAGGRDDRDSGIALKSAGSGSYGSGRAYGRPVESEGGASAIGGRLERERERAQDGWSGPRPLPGGGGGSVLGPGGRADDSGRSPVRPSGLTNGGAAGAGRPSKAFFDKDFPSLRPAAGGSSSPASAAVTATATISSASSAPLAGAAASPLLDTASSGSLLAPYRQTFLSSRTSSNWTSKLAEAPAAPTQQQQQPTPSAAWGGEDVVGASASPSPQAAATPPARPPPQVAPVPAPGPVPPRPASVWGTAAATVAAAAAPGPDVSTGGAAIGISASSRVRLEQLAVRQSKQLVPVISAGGSKSKAGAAGPAAAGGGAGGGNGGRGAGGGGGGGSGGGFVAPPRPSGPSGASMLRFSGGRSGEVATGRPRVLTNNSMILSKKASQPLDRPLTLTLTRTASASSPAVTFLSSTTAPEVGAPAAVAPSASLGNMTATAYEDANAGAVPAASASGGGPAAVAATSLGAPASSMGPTTCTAQQLLEAQHPGSEPDRPAAGLESCPSQDQGEGQGQGHRQQHPALTVTEEEEAFLRSLGWTGFDEEGEESDTGLTEEEIAAFRAQPPQAATPAAVTVAAAGAGAVAAAAAPKPVPAAIPARRAKPLIVAASYGSEQICSSTDSDSECE